MIIIHTSTYIRIYVITNKIILILGFSLPQSQLEISSVQKKVSNSSSFLDYMLIYEKSKICNNSVLRNLWLVMYLSVEYLFHSLLILFQRHFANHAYTSSLIFFWFKYFLKSNINGPFSLFPVLSR